MATQDRPAERVVAQGFQEQQAAEHVDEAAEHVDEATELIDEADWCGNFTYGFLAGMLIGPYGFIGLYYIDERRQK